MGNVDYLGPVSLRYVSGLGDSVNKEVGLLGRGKRYHYSISSLASRMSAFIFAPAGYMEFAFLKTDLPIVYCCDSTITQFIDYYLGLSSLLAVSKATLQQA